MGVQRKKVKILGQKLWLSSVKQTKHQKVIIMKSYQDVQAAYINRTTLMANLYHTNAIKLIDLVLTHNKNAMEASNQRASDILNSKPQNPKTPKPRHRYIWSIIKQSLSSGATYGRADGPRHELG